MTSTGSSGSDRNPLGLFEQQTDVGTVSRPGSCRYDSDRQAYTIEGSGANVWGQHDAFQYVWKRMAGNFIVSARAEFMGAGVDPHRKLGWMVRASLDAGSANVSAGLHGDGLTSLQFRRAAGAPTEELRFAIGGPDVIQLERKGDTYIMSAARFGDPLVAERVADIALGEEVYVGLYVCSHNDDLSERATFRNVRVVVPAKDDFVPYQDFLGSQLEILDIQSGDRQIVYSSPEVFEAPNWTPDGGALIYNSQGRLYRFDLATKIPAAIDTGFATRNNNDHLISFDGTTLGISHHSADDANSSIVYTLPIQGGAPKRITARGPSYLHGWSPDGQRLAYTGARNGEYNIYTISADGGEETQLTNTPGLDDGPEYAPDGSYIYFNSTRSGTMQLWRMRPDGSAQEQLTDDEYNNWFPHLSPDGQSIVFLSYSKEVEPQAHPPYKRVYLRCMPANGGAARVVAYLYGGQGTINVPSWSPDGKRIAFVSNTAMD
jgi:Tol biopolymer transport system component